jgi:ABC-type glycerol-3-phosphate transport system substrate-binding protein
MVHAGRRAKVKHRLAVLAGHLRLSIVLALGAGALVFLPGISQAQKAKLVYYSMFSEGEPLQQVLAQATQDFMTENPDIEIESVWAGRQNLTQLQSVLAAGDQVDLVDHSDDRVYNAVVVPGLALPLDKYLDTNAYGSNKKWKDTFVASALEIGKSLKDGKTYLIARDDYISAYFYNTAVVRDVAVAPPIIGMSWADFTKMLTTIQHKSISPLGADGTVSFYNNWYTAYLMLRVAGKDAFREAAYDKTGQKWRAAEFLRAAHLLNELQDAKFFQPGFQGSVWPAAQVQWVNGKIGMILCGAWLPAEMAPQMPPGFKTDMFAFPVVEGGKGNDLVEHWANTYAILKSTKAPDAAVKYLKYLTSPKVVQAIVKIGVPMPLVGAPTPVGLENQYKILASQTAIPARAGLNTEIPEYMEKVFNVCSDKFFQLQSGPEQFVGCLANSSATYWASK